MMGIGYGMMGGFGWVGMVFQLIILAAIIYLIVYAIRSFSGHHRQGSDATTEATKILAERFARGEISAEEYRAMKEHLK